MDFPFIAFHGDADTLTDPEGTRALGEGAASAGTVRILPGRWHILTREPGHEEVLAELVDWMNARLE